MKVLILAYIRNTIKLKILITGWYILRSITLRGILNSWLMLKDESRYENFFGIRTSSLKKSSSPDFFHYQGASYRVLFRIFNSLPQQVKKFEFFDIGCGKGRAVFVAEHCGFDVCTGIEIDKELLADANTNVNRYKLRRPDSVFLFEHANALEYHYRPGSTVYFLFNPFSEAVLKQVLHSITSTAQKETWFIYMNPLFPAPFSDKSITLVSKLKTRWYTEALIYSYRP